MIIDHSTITTSLFKEITNLQNVDSLWSASMFRTCPGAYQRTWICRILHLNWNSFFHQSDCLNLAWLLTKIRPRAQLFQIRTDIPWWITIFFLTLNRMHVKGTFIFLFDWIVTFGTQPLYNSLSSDCYISISRTFSFLFVWSVILGSGAPLGFFLMGLLR